MNRRYFANPRTDCLEEGLIAVSQDINEEILMEAYANAIFPWPHEEGEVLWFCPDKRGILFFNNLTIPKSLKKLQRNNTYKFTINTAFSQVIKQCAAVSRKEGDGTWLTQQLVAAYKELYKKGYVLSFECWDRENLIGGLYGVFINNIFSGESMFYKKSNASKLCLLHAIKYLQSQGVGWIDTQMVTPVIESLGGKTITRDEYLDLIALGSAHKPIDK